MNFLLMLFFNCHFFLSVYLLIKNPNLLPTSLHLCILTLWGLFFGGGLDAKCKICLNLNAWGLYYVNFTHRGGATINYKNPIQIHWNPLKKIYCSNSYVIKL